MYYFIIFAFYFFVKTLTAVLIHENCPMILTITSYDWLPLHAVIIALTSSMWHFETLWGRAQVVTPQLLKKKRVICASNLNSPQHRSSTSGWGSLCNLLQ